MPSQIGPGALAGATGAGERIAERQYSPNNTPPHQTASIARLEDLRFRRDVIRLHRLGPRVLHAFLCDLAARRLLRTEIEALAALYADRLNPELVRIVGADRWPPSCLVVEP